MESREKKMSEPNDDEEDPDPKLDDEVEPSLDSLGRPVSGSRSTHGSNIGLNQKTNNSDTSVTVKISRVKKKRLGYAIPRPGQLS